MSKEIVLRGGQKILGTLASGIGDNVLTYSSSSRSMTSIPPIDTSSFVTTALASAKLFVGSGSNIATAVALSGDITITNTGVVTLQANTITDGHISSVASISRSKLAAGTAYALLANSSSGVMSEVATIGTSGQVLTSNGAGVLPSWQTVTLINPMTTVGDLIIGGVAGVTTRLAASTSGYALKANGVGVAPSWQAMTSQEFVFNGITIQNPANTFHYIVSGGAITGNRTFFLPVLTTLSDTVVALAATQVLSNKSMVDSTFSIQDNADATKLLAFQVSGVTTGTTRTLTVPNASGTIAISGSGNIALNATTGDITFTGTLPQANGGTSYHPIFAYSSSAGNGTTVETDLYTDTIAAGQLGTNNSLLQGMYAGSFVTSGGTATREIKVYFGGTAIFDSGAVLITANSSWNIYFDIIRVSATVVRYEVSMVSPSAPLAAYASVGELTGLTLSGTNTLKITGQAAGVGAATNDIVAKMGSVAYIGPAY